MELHFFSEALVEGLSGPPHVRFSITLRVFLSTKHAHTAFTPQHLQA